MGPWSKAKEAIAARQALKAEGGFDVAATYLGGFPVEAEMGLGRLTMSQDQLRFSGRTKVRFRPGRRYFEFAIGVAELEEIAFKDQDELRKAPKGYWAPLGIPWFPGYGSKSKNPLTQRNISGLLTVSYHDRHGDEHRVVFANFTDGQLSFSRELANKIDAARYRTKEQRK